MSMSEEVIFLQPKEAARVVEGFFFPPFISLAHVFNASKGWTIGPRRFRQYQLQYVLSGAASYRIENRYYETKKGDLILHFPNEDHEVRTIDGMPYVCVSIVFHFGQTHFPLVELLLPGQHYMGNFENTQLESALTAIPAEYNQPERLHRLRAQSLLMEIIYTLLHNQRNSHNSAGSQDAATSIQKHKTQANLVLLKNYVKEHYAKEITYEHLEKLTGWSKNYILLRFKETYNITPMQFQIQLRMDKAKELAIQSNMTITEIAYHIGYSNVHTFGKVFKKKTGLSMSEFCSSLLY